MIFIVEIPHTRSPFCWSANFKEDVIQIIEKNSQSSGDVIFEEISVREMLEIEGFESAEEALENEHPYIPSLAAQYGLDTPLYKEWENDDWTDNKPDKFERYTTWNGHDLHTQRVYVSDEEALDDAQNDSRWDCHQGGVAQQALIKELEKMGYWSTPNTGFQGV